MVLDCLRISVSVLMAVSCRADMPVTLELEEESITCALATLSRAPELEHFDGQLRIA